MKRLILATIALLASEACFAQHVDIIGAYKSAPGQTEQQFAIEVGTTLQTWSAQTHEEACGQLTTDGTLFAVVLVTEHSHGACGEPQGAILPGFHLIHKTIHVHPTITHYHTTPEDVAMGDPRNVDITITQGVFSAADYATGPGYLVTDHKLLYQDHPNTQTVISAL